MELQEHAVQRALHVSARAPTRVLAFIMHPDTYKYHGNFLFYWQHNTWAPDLVHRTQKIVGLHYLGDSQWKCCNCARDFPVNIMVEGPYAKRLSPEEYGTSRLVVK